ncbi:hypothetical protein N8787_05410 [Opitutaceae bacterium]|nr:hypothetical protein [Opitutaceae bacterium]
MKRIRNLIIGSLAIAVAVSVSAADDSESGYYAFSSGDLVAAYKSGFLPVLSGDKKGVYVDTDRGIKRISYSTECRLLPKLLISDQVVTISDVKYGFDNLQQSQAEASAMTETMRNEAATERTILMRGGGIAGSPPEGPSEEVQAQIDEMKTLQKENSEFVKESLENDAYYRGELCDIINVRFNLLPETDLENVYCVMVVRYLQRDFNFAEKYSKARVVRMKKIGNLDTGRPNKVRYSYPLPEGFVNDKGIELFLFYGDGNPLATNLSRNLRQLTVEELEKSRP